MSEALVSMIMPAWRPRSDWLHQAVKAALGQSGCRIELVVVDDGSPAPVAELLSDVEDSRLRVIRIQHGGASAARNAGIAEAEGAYLRFIDTDDMIAAGSTAHLLGLIDGREDVLAYGATVFCDEELRPLWKMTSDVQGDALIPCLLDRFTTRAHAFLFPRQVIDRNGEWSTEIVVSEDWDFILRALAHASVQGTHETATFYRRHPGGLTADLEEAARGAEQVVDRYFERHPEQRGTPLERKARARLLAHTGRASVTHGEVAKGLARLARAGVRDPGSLAVEVVQGIPALRGRLRSRVRGRARG
jgi:glycosyltransferase involved in cell wall biosynthesis